MSSSTHPRPGFGVSVVGALTMFSGILNVVAGIILLFTREDINGDFPSLSEGEIALFGVAAIVFGLIYILVGRGMLRMSRFALGLGLLVAGINLVSGVLLIIFEGISNLHYSILVSTLISLVVFLILSSGFSRASEARRD
ncbi:hypothetical protein HJD18_02135 [Thermoleophilia bacterium SCSIO 60948]|nr:hypothetical protein HJD18_02135 [Thermoleophilia bacterium SCSIO 60948]